MFHHGRETTDTEAVCFQLHHLPGKGLQPEVLEKLRLPVQEGMIPPGGNRWSEKKFQNRSMKRGILPYDPTIPLLGNIPHTVETNIEYKCAEVHSCIIHNSKKWKQPPQLHILLNMESYIHLHLQWNIQFSSVAQSCPTLWTP